MIRRCIFKYRVLSFDIQSNTGIIKSAFFTLATFFNIHRDTIFTCMSNNLVYSEPNTLNL